MTEKTILEVLREQQLEVQSYDTTQWCSRYEEQFFEWKSNLAQVVTGVRRSGKSTLCHKVLLDQGIKYGYANLDDDRLMDMRTSDLNVVLECIYRLYGTDVQYIFFDELQDVEGWYLFANRLLRTGIKLIITGSNAKLLSGELATHLTGRYNEIKLFPFSFAEYSAHYHVDGDITTKAEANRKRALDNYLHDGGLPELFRLDTETLRRGYVESVLETIITKDIAKRFKIRNTESLRRITNHLLNNVGQEINYEALANISNLKSNTTTQKYVTYLAQAFLIHRVRKFSYKSQERIRGEKAYVVDTGFIANRENSLLGENVGWRLENAVCIELLRRHRSMAEDIYYYKPTSRSKEVDFVVCHQGVVKELIQVAYSIDDKNTLKREVESLSMAAAKLKCTNLTLIAFADTCNMEHNNQIIHIQSATDWLRSDTL